MILVFDTNVFIAAALKGGFSLSAIRMAVDGTIVLATTEDILLELREKLLKKFRYSIERADQFIETLREICLIVEPDRDLEVRLRDPDDNKVLQAASAAQADLIVSMDRDILDLGELKISQKVVGICHPSDLGHTLPGFFQSA